MIPATASSPLIPFTRNNTPQMTVGKKVMATT
jgi:hypothetical protein